MQDETSETGLMRAQSDLRVTLRNAISLWATATTAESERRADLLRRWNAEDKD